MVGWPHGGGWEQRAQSGVGVMDECESQGQKGEGVHRNVGERRKNGRQMGRGQPLRKFLRGRRWRWIQAR